MTPENEVLQPSAETDRSYGVPMPATAIYIDPGDLSAQEVLGRLRLGGRAWVPYDVTDSGGKLVRCWRQSRG